MGWYFFEILDTIGGGHLNAARYIREYLEQHVVPQKPFINKNFLLNDVAIQVGTGIVDISQQAVACLIQSMPEKMEIIDFDTNIQLPMLYVIFLIKLFMDTKTYRQTSSKIRLFFKNMLRKEDA